MKRLLQATCLLLLTSSTWASAKNASDTWDDLLAEMTFKHPSLVFVEHNPKLKNVFIYGDSISIGYTEGVRKRLKDSANVYRLHRNGGDSAVFIKNVRHMSEVMRNPEVEGHWDFDWDVIHFNVGLHDLKYNLNGKLNKDQGTQIASTDTYAKNLKAIVEYLKEYAPNATLIFALTTPVPDGEPGRFRGDAIIYNKVARDVLKNYPEVLINDLYEFTIPHQIEWWAAPGNVHFNKTGRDAQAEQVAKVISEQLNKR